MKPVVYFALAALVAGSLATISSAGQTSPATARSASAPGLSAAESAIIAKRVESFLREQYAWGPEYKVEVSTPTSSPVPDLFAVSVTVTAPGGTDSATMYVTKDGHYIFRGDLQDLTKDPTAEIRGQLHLDGYPSKGPKDAKIVIVEFGDFECPSCRQLDSLLRAILPQYPNVRFVFKDFPLEQIHPWAMTAAIAARCALQQSPEAFWKLHDAIYDNQDVTSPENAYDKLADLAQQSGVKLDAYRACMVDPKTPDPIRNSQEEGRSLQISSTPTTFVDGRRLIGPDATLLKQYLDFDKDTAQNHK